MGISWQIGFSRVSVNQLKSQDIFWYLIHLTPLLLPPKPGPQPKTCIRDTTNALPLLKDLSAAHQVLSFCGLHEYQEVSLLARHLLRIAMTSSWLHEECFDTQNIPGPPSLLSVCTDLWVALKSVSADLWVALKSANAQPHAERRAFLFNNSSVEAFWQFNFSIENNQAIRCICQLKSGPIKALTWQRGCRGCAIGLWPHIRAVQRSLAAGAAVGTSDTQSNNATSCIHQLQPN